MTYLFRTPIRQQGPRVPVDASGAERALFQHFVMHQGYPVAVLVTGNTVTEVQVPTDAQVRAADYAYLGGRENQVPDSVAAVLIAAGYTLTAI